MNVILCYRVQAALDAAMNNMEEDIDIDALAITNAFAVKGTRKEKSHKKLRPKSSKKEKKENYPESRGLVPKWEELAHCEAGSDIINYSADDEDTSDEDFDIVYLKNSNFLDYLCIFCLACFFVRIIQIAFGFIDPFETAICK